MKDWIDAFREAYKSRDKSLIGRLAERMDEDGVVVGTALDENARGGAGLAELLESDFKYWVDIDIAQAYQEEMFGAFCLYTLSADALCRFTVNEKTYERYAGYMRDITTEAIPAYAKAVKIIWELDHLIASKPGVRHLDKKKLVIHLLTRENKILMISYSHVYLKNHVDCFAGAQADIDGDFAATRAFFTPDAALTARLTDEIRPDGLRLTGAAAEKHGDWFVGCGALVNDETLDEEIERDFAALDEAETAYRRLYQLRKRLGETLRLYSFGAPQEIMTRFFGVTQGDRIVCFRHTYPFYWILED